MGRFSDSLTQFIANVSKQNDAACKKVFAGARAILQPTQVILILLILAVYVIVLVVFFDLFDIEHRGVRFTFLWSS